MSGRLIAPENQSPSALANRRQATACVWLKTLSCPILPAAPQPLSEDNIAVDVLVQKIDRLARTGGIELLRTERSHPDEVINPDFVPGIAKIIQTLTLQHEQSVFHDVGLDGWKTDAGLEEHQIHLKIEPEVAHWQQVLEAAPLQSGMVRHRHRLLLTGDCRRCRYALNRFIALFDRDNAGGSSGMAVHRERRAGRNVGKGAGCKQGRGFGANG